MSTTGPRCDSFNLGHNFTGCFSNIHYTTLYYGYVVLQLLLALAGSKFRRTHGYILLSQIRDSTSIEGEALVYMSHRNEVPGYTLPLGTGFPYQSVTLPPAVCLNQFILEPRLLRLRAPRVIFCNRPVTVVVLM
jgi:hypothetical protein